MREVLRIDLHVDFYELIRRYLLRLPEVVSEIPDLATLDQDAMVRMIDEKISEGKISEPLMEMIGMCASQSKEYMEDVLEAAMREAAGSIEGMNVTIETLGDDKGSIH